MKKKKQKDDRQRRFIREYLKSYNATQAAKTAGYSEKTAYSQGARLLKNVEIQRAIEAQEHNLENKIGITKERILKELALIGFSSIDEHLEVDAGGTVRAKSFDEMPIAAVRCIKKIKQSGQSREQRTSRLKM
jgi:phage terminase small subunit